jgi:hypothetical protein
MRGVTMTFLFLGLLTISACSTTRVSLPYQAGATPIAAVAKPLVSVGAFSDQRGTDPHWLGAIRGGFGNPLKTLELENTASEMMKEAFSQALTSRGLLASNAAGRYTLSGVIQKFDCSQFVRREAHATIIVTVTETATGKTVMNQSFEETVVTGEGLTLDAGILASTDDLKAVAAQALQKVIDDVLNGSTFTGVIQTASIPD